MFKFKIIDLKQMGFNKVDFNWNIMVTIKDFSCPHVGIAKTKVKMLVFVNVMWVLCQKKKLVCIWGPMWYYTLWEII
jgi:hypothetical protein